MRNKFCPVETYHLMIIIVSVNLLVTQDCFSFPHPNIQVMLHQYFTGVG